MTNLNEIFGLNKYCGPAVLSALTGKSTDECARVITEITGKQVITGVQIPDLLDAVKRLGFVSEEIQVRLYSVYGLLKQIHTDEGFYIIHVPKHVIAVEVTNGNGIYLIDNHTKRALNAAASARLSQKVEGCWKVRGKSDTEKNAELKKYLLDQKERFIKEIVKSNDWIESCELKIEEIDKKLQELENGMS